MRRLLALILVFSTLPAFADWRKEIMEDASEIFGPVSLSTYQKPFRIEIEVSPIVAASAHHEDHELKVVIYQGLLDSKKLTPDGLRMTLCHELGHLFGGAPRKSLPMEWEGPIAPDGKMLLSTEGQAEYYAGLICFRKLARQGKPLSVSLESVGPKLKKACEETAKLTGEELNLCYRSALAGENFLKLPFDFAISTEQSDRREVRSTIEGYASHQCRLDTIVNAGLCSENFPLVMNFNDESKNTCGQSFAKRPSCWFRP